MCPLAAMLEVHCFWQQQLRTADPICKLMTWLPQQYGIDMANFCYVSSWGLMI